jgi:hypothetical protein
MRVSEGALQLEVRSKPPEAQVIAQIITPVHDLPQPREWPVEVAYGAAYKEAYHGSHQDIHTTAYTIGRPRMMYIRNLPRQRLSS